MWMWIIIVLFLGFIMWIRHNPIDASGELNKKKKPRKRINWDKICWSKQLEIEIIGQRYAYINMHKKILKDLEI
jgi:hypothetical protein